MTESRSVHDDLGERLANIKLRIEQTLDRTGRSTDDLTLIAITKTHPTSIIKEAIALGASDLGENRVQEAEPKIIEIGRSKARWHLVGHLQPNKARRAVKLFDVIHSLDSIELSERLNRLCIEEERETLPVLIQVDLGLEATKTGVPETKLNELVDQVAKCEYLQLTGLMTLPPFFDDPEDARPYFRKLALIRNKLVVQGAFGNGRGELSMGMSHDFEVAIEEGATMVRIGTAIFGERTAQL
jgi:pyridoxal phosphate enzyme (YggS family)